jgi:hypothetical protein
MAHPRKRKPRRRPDRKRRSPRAKTRKRQPPAPRHKRPEPAPPRRPPPTPEFSDAAFEQHFAPILAHYRRKRETLSRLRTLFNRLAADLARLVKRTMDDAYANAVYGQVLDGVPNAPAAASLPRPCNFEEAHLARVLGHPRGGDGAGPHVFDPWTGRWQGRWTSGPSHPATGTQSANPSPQHHIWGTPRPVGGATVQPVSQSESGFVDGDNIDGETGAGRADLAINVYDDAVGIGGWVSKRQGGQDFELPSIGFRVAPGVLIWICQEDDSDCHALEDTYFLYFEWVDENGVYGILGMRLAVDGNTVRALTAAESYPGECHGGVYRRS